MIVLCYGGTCRFCVDSRAKFEWCSCDSKYRGQGDGSLWVGGYDSSGAPFPPIGPATECNGTCRDKFVASLNATDFNP